MKSPLLDFSLPVIGFVLVLLLWQGAVWALALPPSVLPAPLDVLHGLWVAMQGQVLWYDISQTLLAALEGLLIGTVVALALGILVGESKTADMFLYPLIVWLQAMPIIAIAPLLIVWFGIGLASKVAVVAIAIFFPVFINTVAGMHAAPADLVELYRGYGASRLRTIIDVKFPAALHYVFSGLQVAVTMALLSCVVGEFLAAKAGLGYRIKSLGQQLDLTGMFVVVLVLSIMGICAGWLVSRAKRSVVFWHEERR